MSVFAYLALALVAGGVWGTALAFLLNAPRKKTGEAQQWLATGAAMLVVIACAVFMKYVGDLSAVAFLTKALAAAAFVISFLATFIRCKVRLK